MHKFILFATVATLSFSASAAPTFPIVIEGSTCEDQSVPPCDDPASLVNLAFTIEEWGEVEMALDDVILYHGVWDYSGRKLQMDFVDSDFRFDITARRVDGPCVEGIWDLTGEGIPETLRFLWNGCY